MYLILYLDSNNSIKRAVNICLKSLFKIGVHVKRNSMWFMMKWLRFRYSLCPIDIRVSSKCDGEIAFQSLLTNIPSNERWRENAILLSPFTIIDSPQGPYNTWYGLMCCVFFIWFGLRNSNKPSDAFDGKTNTGERISMANHEHLVYIQYRDEYKTNWKRQNSNRFQFDGVEFVVQRGSGEVGIVALCSIWMVAQFNEDKIKREFNI